jgi:hypothetical protein
MKPAVIFFLHAFVITVSPLNQYYLGHCVVWGIFDVQGVSAISLFPALIILSEFSRK